MLQSYSYATIKNYRVAFLEFCQAHDAAHPDAISPEAAQSWLTMKVKNEWSHRLCHALLLHTDAASQQLGVLPAISEV